MKRRDKTIVALQNPAFHLFSYGKPITNNDKVDGKKKERFASKTRKCVITGGPGSGKTALLNKLSTLGYFTVPEAARLVAQREARLTGKPVSEIKRWNYNFQKKILKTQIDLEKAVPTGKLVFLDRGIPDGIAYLAVANLKPFPELVTAARNCRYCKVFCLELLPTRHTDNMRNENYATARKIQTLLEETYSSLGYKVKLIPALPTNERAKFILRLIKK